VAAAAVHLSERRTMRIFSGLSGEVTRAAAAKRRDELVRPPPRQRKMPSTL
jgi:hypothetical protein